MLTNSCYAIIIHRILHIAISHFHCIQEREDTCAFVLISITNILPEKASQTI